MATPRVSYIRKTYPIYETNILYTKRFRLRTCSLNPVSALWQAQLNNHHMKYLRRNSPISIASFFYLLAAIIAGIVWGGVIGIIFLILRRKHVENRSIHKLLNVGKTGIIVLCVVVCCLLMERLLKYWYTFSDIESIHQRYEQIFDAIQEEKFPHAYSLMSPTYRQQYSLQTFIHDPPSDFYVSRKTARDIDVRWDKVTAMLTPHNIQAGPTFLFVNIGGTWYMEKQTDYWW